MTPDDTSPTIERVRAWRAQIEADGLAPSQAPPDDAAGAAQGAVSRHVLDQTLTVRDLVRIAGPVLFVVLLAIVAVRAFRPGDAPSTIVVATPSPLPSPRPAGPAIRAGVPMFFDITMAHPAPVLDHAVGYTPTLKLDGMVQVVLDGGGVVFVDAANLPSDARLATLVERSAERPTPPPPVQPAAAPPPCENVVVTVPGDDGTTMTGEGCGEDAARAAAVACLPDSPAFVSELDIGTGGSAAGYSCYSADEARHNAEIHAQALRAQLMPTATPPPSPSMIVSRPPPGKPLQPPVLQESANCPGQSVVSSERDVFYRDTKIGRVTGVGCTVSAAESDAERRATEMLRQYTAGGGVLPSWMRAPTQPPEPTGEHP